jgi:hypothetical protein
MRQYGIAVSEIGSDKGVYIALDIQSPHLHCSNFKSSCMYNRAVPLYLKDTFDLLIISISLIQRNRAEEACLHCSCVHFVGKHMQSPRPLYNIVAGRFEPEGAAILAQASKGPHT